MSDHEKRVIDRPDIRALSYMGETERLKAQLVDEHQRAEQLGLNIRWLIKQIDAAHDELDGKLGTWQDQAKQLVPNIKRLKVELAELRSAICEFVDKHAWADETWKRHPHIKKLFDIAAKERA